MGVTWPYPRWCRCPVCGIERADAEIEGVPASTAGGIAQDADEIVHHLDTCPNCGAEDTPEVVRGNP